MAGNLVYIGFIFAPTWQWVMSGMVFGAITRSLIGPSFNAFIAEQSAEHNRARVFGITDTLFMIISVIGPPLGGDLVDEYGFRIMLAVAWFFYLIATIIRVSMSRIAARVVMKLIHKSYLSGACAPTWGPWLGCCLAAVWVTWILITDGVRDIAWSLSYNLLPVYLEQIGGMTYQQIGWLGSAFGVCMMLVTIPAGWLADKKGDRVGIVIGFLIEFVAMVTFLQVQGFWGYAVVWGILGLGAGMMSPAYNSLISKAVPEKLRRHSLWVVWHQRGVGLTTGTRPRCHDVGALQPAYAILRNWSGCPAECHPSLV